MTWVVVSITPILTLAIILSIQYFVTKENKKVSLNHVGEHFVMQPVQKFAKFLRVAIYLLDIIMAVVLCIGAFQDPLVVLIVSPFVFVLMYLMTWICVNIFEYKLIVSRNTITYRGPFSKKIKIFTFMDISYFVIKSSGYGIDTLHAYSKDKKRLFVVNSNLSFYDKFLSLINEQNFEILTFN